MSETQLREIADFADMIVNGYAFTIAGDVVRVLNLNSPACAAVFSSEGEMLETSMDDIELHIVSDYLRRNADALEASHAYVLQL